MAGGWRLAAGAPACPALTHACAHAAPRARARPRPRQPSLAQGARAIVAEAYRLWLQYEVRTDDITIILMFLDWKEDGLGDMPPPNGSPGDRRRSMFGGGDDRRRLSSHGPGDLISMGLELQADGNRPVRRGLSKEKKSLIMTAQSAMAAEDDLSLEDTIKPTPKTPEEIARISAAVKTNFLFSHLNEAQRTELYMVMKRVEVKAGDVIIRQGDPGDWFYVVDSGVFAVTQKQGEPGKEKEVHIFTYKNEGGVHHCFGELALMYSKPRAATVTADTDGVLWAMARSSFRRVLMKSSAHTLTKVLRSVDILKSLSTVQLQRLQDILSEEKFKEGENIITQGESGNTFFIIVEGNVVCTRKEDPGDDAESPQELMRLNQYQYFGERALLHDAPRAATVTACVPCKCLSVERAAFEEVLGPLQSIIDDDAKWREKQALIKQLETESVGLNNTSLADFGVLAIVKQGDIGDISIVVKQHDHQEHPGYYTVRSMSKAQVVNTKQEALVVREHELMAELPVSSPGVAVELVSYTDANAVHAVLKSVIVTNLEALMEEDVLPETTARFYIANLAQALCAVHEASIVYRNVNPEFIYIDIAGYVQLIDFRLAKRIEGKTFTTCGAPEYLVRAARERARARASARARGRARGWAGERAGGRVGGPERASCCAHASSTRARTHARTPRPPRARARAPPRAGPGDRQGRGPRHRRRLLGARRARVRDAHGPVALQGQGRNGHVHEHHEPQVQGGAARHVGAWQARARLHRRAPPPGSEQAARGKECARARERTARARPVCQCGGRRAARAPESSHAHPARPGALPAPSRAPPRSRARGAAEPHVLPRLRMDPPHHAQRKGARSGQARRRRVSAGPQLGSAERGLASERVSGVPGRGAAHMRAPPPPPLTRLSARVPPRARPPPRANSPHTTRSCQSSLTPCANARSSP